MNPSERQVGGSHYVPQNGSLQHWDVLPELGYSQEYYLAVASKYVLRWRNKNGIEDLRKAEHFLDKVISLLDENKLTFYTRANFISESDPSIMRDFLAGYVLSYEEQLALTLILAPGSHTDLLRARRIVGVLIAGACGELPVTDNLTVGDATLRQWANYTFEAYVEDDAAWQCRACNHHFRQSIAVAPDCPRCHGVVSVARD